MYFILCVFLLHHFHITNALAILTLGVKGKKTNLRAKKKISFFSIQFLYLMQAVYSGILAAYLKKKNITLYVNPKIKTMKEKKK